MPVLVLGMHRSGTSALTHLIHLLGLSVGRSDDLMSPQPDNPLGFWESSSLTRLNDRLLEAVGGRWWLPPRGDKGIWKLPRAARLRNDAEWTIEHVYGGSDAWVWKDPRNCLTLPFWIESLPSRPVVVFIHRHPLEVVTSLRQRNGLPPLIAAGLWETYNRRALDQMQGLAVFALSYDQLLTAPVELLGRLAAFLAKQGFAVEQSPDAAGIKEHILQEFRHHRFGELDLIGSGLSLQQRSLYEYLIALPEASQRFHAGALPNASPMVDAILDQFGGITKRHELEQAQWEQQIRQMEQELRDLRRTLEQAQTQQSELVESAHKERELLEVARNELLEVRGQLTNAREQHRAAAAELQEVRAHYGKLRFRMAETVNRMVHGLPGAHFLLRMPAVAAERLYSLFARRPNTTGSSEGAQLDGVSASDDDGNTQMGRVHPRHEVSFPHQPADVGAAGSDCVGDVGYDAAERADSTR